MTTTTSPEAPLALCLVEEEFSFFVSSLSLVFFFLSLQAKKNMSY